MCSWIHHLGEPDVRHSHQTFQIKRPPHPSTPLRNPVSISLSRTIKPPFCFYTHMLANLNTYLNAHTLYVETHHLFLLIFPREAAERAHFWCFCNSDIALGCKTSLSCQTRHCGLSYLMWKGVVNVICMLHWCSNSSLNASSAEKGCDCTVGEQTSVSDDISCGLLNCPGWDMSLYHKKNFTHLIHTPAALRVTYMHIYAILCVLCVTVSC